MPPTWDTPVTTGLRRSLCRPTDTILGLFLRTGLSLVALKVSPLAEGMLRQRFGRSLYIPVLSYSMANFLTVMEALEPVLGPDGAAVALAEAMLTPFFGSPMGNLMFSLARATPHDLIEASVMGYRACVNWGTRTYTKIGPREATMQFQDDLLGPAWHAVGIFPPAIKRVCGVDATVVVEDVDEARSNFTLRTTWK